MPFANLKSLIMRVLIVGCFTSPAFAQLTINTEKEAEEYLKALGELPLAWVDTEKAALKAYELGKDWPILHEEDNLVEYLEYTTSDQFKNLQQIANQCKDISLNVDKTAQLLGYADNVSYSDGIQLSLDYDGADNPMDTKIEFGFRAKLGKDFLEEQLGIEGFSDPYKLIDIVGIDVDRYHSLHPRYQKILSILIEKITSAMMF